MPKEIITLHGPGGLAGIPGTHGPGAYLVDWDARTIEPVLSSALVDVQAMEAPPEPPGEPTQPLEQAGAEAPTADSESEPTPTEGGN